MPHWGRAFETLSEDPYLAGRLAVAEIDGIESTGVLATVKHYAANNQETLRMSIDAKVSPRALRTIYLPAFEAAVREAAVGSVMCSYNRVNGAYGCEHPWLLTDVLRKEWGYEGFVMSDWFATHSTEAAALAGLDMEMPGGANAFGRFPEYFGDALKKAVADGKVPAAVLDEKVKRILTMMFRVGLFDRVATGSPDAVVTSPEHQRLARAIVEQGAVLLKNAGGVLPFAGVTSVALIGDAAGEHAKITGGGSADVKSSRVRLATVGITDRAGAVGEGDDGARHARHRRAAGHPDGEPHAAVRPGAGCRGDVLPVRRLLGHAGRDARRAEGRGRLDDGAAGRRAAAAVVRALRRHAGGARGRNLPLLDRGLGCGAAVPGREARREPLGRALRRRHARARRPRRRQARRAPRRVPGDRSRGETRSPSAGSRPIRRS